MIPRRSLIALAVMLTLGGVIAALVPMLAGAWLAVASVALIMAGVDAVIGMQVAAPHIDREAPGSMSLSTWADIKLTVRNHSSRRSVTVQIFDHHPQSFTARGLPLTFQVEPDQTVDVSYRVCPTLRGPESFPGCGVRVSSPLGLWWRSRFVATQSLVRVYPNYSTISKLLAYEVDNRLQLAGVRMSRRRGEGIEFHQLRDYREGDSLRSVDWKATARMGRLIAREYQDERDQQIVFVLDAGRRMLAKDADTATSTTA